MSENERGEFEVMKAVKWGLSIIAILSLMIPYMVANAAWIRVYDHDYDQKGPSAFCYPVSSWAYAYVDGLVSTDPTDPQAYLVRDAHHNYAYGGLCAYTVFVTIYPGNGNDGVYEAFTEVVVIEFGLEYGARAIAQITIGGGM